jgi:hypothetical protein
MTAIRPIRTVTLLVLALAWLSPAPCHADICLTVQLQTAPLVGHPAGPFSLDFQLNDGRGFGDANNTAMLSAFAFGGGSPSGTPTTTGGAMGDLATMISITDSQFLNEFMQGFNPGSTLSFTLMLTTQVDPGPQPDEFSFFILDHTGTPIPTLDPVVGRSAFMIIDIDSPTPLVQVFGSNPAIPPAGGGPGINIPAPSAVDCPEPDSIILLLCGGALLANWYRGIAYRRGPISKDVPMKVKGRRG